MSNNFDEILITSTGSKWHEKIKEIHEAIRQATYFDDGSENDRTLNEILRKVKKSNNIANILWGGRPLQGNPVDIILLNFFWR